MSTVPVNNLSPRNIRLSVLYPNNLLLSGKMPVTLLKILKNLDWWSRQKPHSPLGTSIWLSFHLPAAEDRLLMQSITHAFKWTGITLVNFKIAHKASFGENLWSNQTTWISPLLYPSFSKAHPLGLLPNSAPSTPGLLAILHLVLSPPAPVLCFSLLQLISHLPTSLEKYPRFLPLS